MKNLILAVLVISFLLASLSLVYNLGVREGLNVYEHSVKDGVAERYIETIGNPKTQDEQCVFDYVVYGDKSECR